MTKLHNLLARATYTPKFHTLENPELLTAVSDVLDQLRKDLPTLRHDSDDAVRRLVEFAEVLLDGGTAEIYPQLRVDTARFRAGTHPAMHRLRRFIAGFVDPDWGKEEDDPARTRRESIQHLGFCWNFAKPRHDNIVLSAIALYERAMRDRISEDEKQALVQTLRRFREASKQELVPVIAALNVIGTEEARQELAFYGLIDEEPAGPPTDAPAEEDTPSPDAESGPATGSETTHENELASEPETVAEVDDPVTHLIDRMLSGQVEFDPGVQAIIEFRNLDPNNAKLEEHLLQLFAKFWTEKVRERLHSQKTPASSADSALC